LSTLEKKVKSGIKWSAIAQIIVQVIKLVRWFGLLYFISPANFGLFALAVLLVSFPQTFLDQGIGSAVIQSKEKFSQLDLSTYFWTLVGYNIVLFLLFIFLSKFLANFFSEPDLAQLLIFLSAAFLVESFGKLSGALIRKSLNFKFLAQAEAIIFLLSTVLVLYLATQEYEAFALAAGLFMEYFLTAIIYIFNEKFRPHFIFSLNSLRKIYTFSRNISLTHLTTFIIPMRLITNRIILVLFPIYSTQGIEKREIQTVHLKVLKYAAIAYFFILVGILAFITPVVDIFLPVAWSKLSFFIKILSLGGVIHAFINFNYSIFLSLDRSDLQLKYGLITRGIVTFSYLIGVFWGMEGIAYAYVLGSLIAFFPESIKALEQIEIKLIDFWEVIKQPFLLAALTLFFLLLLLSYLEQDLMKLIIGGAFYFICLAIFYFKIFKKFDNEIFRSHTKD